MTYTDTDLEPAARRLCEIRGIDPDAHGDNQFTWGYPLWHALRDELRAHLEREQALAGTLYLNTDGTVVLATGTITQAIEQAVNPYLSATPRLPPCGNDL